ncbi:MAG: hypothetical protein GY913_21560 [Proteobacteria bacterium]|nr:hypothetical protein [Actinomycetes bacterium]MCP4919497.1 hypothetical protein [Pseudomonadota bacterium]
MENVDILGGSSDLANEILGEAQARLRAQRPVQDIDPEEQDFVIDQHYLIELANEFMTGRLPDPSEADNWTGHRIYRFSWDAALSNLLGKVLPMGVHFMLHNALKHGIDAHSKVQTNGNWVLHRYAAVYNDRERYKTTGIEGEWEVRVGGGRKMTARSHPKRRKRLRERFLVVHFEIIDTLGNEDLLYENGRPVGTQPNRAALPKEVIDLLTRAATADHAVAGASQLAEENAELRSQVADLAAKMNDIIAALPPSKRKSLTTKAPSTPEDEG